MPRGRVGSTDAPQMRSQGYLVSMPRGRVGSTYRGLRALHLPTGINASRARGFDESLNLPFDKGYGYQCLAGAWVRRYGPAWDRGADLYQCLAGAWVRPTTRILSLSTAVVSMPRGRVGSTHHAHSFSKHCRRINASRARGFDGDPAVYAAHGYGINASRARGFDFIFKVMNAAGVRYQCLAGAWVRLL